MKKSLTIINLFISGWIHSQSIATFISLDSTSQDQTLKLPCTHSWQLLIQEGQTLSTGSTFLSTTDYTAFFPVNGNDGILSVNHENFPGAVSLHHIYFDSLQKLWSLDTSYLVDFSDVVNVYKPCSGGISPWGTLFIGEESTVLSDANSDGYNEDGWICEIDPFTGLLMDPDSNGTKDKNWAMGRLIHENVCFTSDSTTAYFGADDPANGFIYKFVAAQKGNFHSGSLYVLRKNNVLDSTGIWLSVPNATASERNDVVAFCSAAGAANFEMVEDVEIGPDDKIYFAASANGRIYRFMDLGSTVDQCDIYVDNQSYPVQTVNGPASFTWKPGSDNLAFDPGGNLWVMQDGYDAMIYVIGSSHSSSTPDVRIFAQVPAGGEPTGINFSPDGKFLFMSVQHPSIANSDTVYDASGAGVVFNKAATLVIARKEILGNAIDASISGIPAIICDNDPLPVSVNAYSGIISGNGIINDTLYPSVAGEGNHTIQYAYSDSSGCLLHAYFDFSYFENPVSAGIDDTICIGGSYFLASSPFGGTWTGTHIDPAGNVNTDSTGTGIFEYIYSHTDTNNCTNSDTVLLVIDDCNSICEIESDDEIIIYPNPGNGIIYVNKVIDEADIEVWNVLGRKVKFGVEKSEKSGMIILKDSYAGIYLIRIGDEMMRYVRY